MAEITQFKLWLKVQNKANNNIALLFFKFFMNNQREKKNERRFHSLCHHFQFLWFAYRSSLKSEKSAKILVIGNRLFHMDFLS